MKIHEVLISNILSFAPTNDIQKDPATISFTSPKSDTGLYVVIGPNGSGKSNFAEIINQIFRKFLFQPSNFNSVLLEQVRNKTATQTQPMCSPRQGI